MHKKKRSSRRGRAGNVIKQGAIGGAAGIATEIVLSKMGAPNLAVDAGYVVAATVGNKVGVYGNAVARQAVKRFGGGLGFLNGGNGGNGNGSANVFNGGA